MAAAQSIEESAATLRAAVFDFILHSGGSTDQEIQVGLRMPGNTERPRRRELEMAGRIRDSGIRRTTEAEREAIVWIATDGAEASPLMEPAPRPSKREMRTALADLRVLLFGKTLSPELIRFGRWLASVCERKG